MKRSEVFFRKDKTTVVWGGLFVMMALCCSVSAQNLRIGGHTFVDLGLPSGLLWAETNIGAASAADAGAYFAWGETRSKDNYVWGTYRYGTGEENITKYKASDSNGRLERADDVACAQWGKGCRMPTSHEFAELRDTTHCTWTWTRCYASDGTSVWGYLVSSKYNGRSIFLPAAGCRNGNSLLYSGTRGYYWSSTLNALYNCYANYLCIESDQPYGGHDDRFYGLTIRPVAEK